jgi:hypothetical protein
MADLTPSPLPRKAQGAVKAMQSPPNHIFDPAKDKRWTNYAEQVRVDMIGNESLDPVEPPNQTS